MEVSRTKYVASWPSAYSGTSVQVTDQGVSSAPLSVAEQPVTGVSVTVPSAAVSLR